MIAVRKLLTYNNIKRKLMNSKSTLSCFFSNFGEDDVDDMDALEEKMKSSKMNEKFNSVDLVDTTLPDNSNQAISELRINTQHERKYDVYTPDPVYGNRVAKFEFFPNTFQKNVNQPSWSTIYFAAKFWEFGMNSHNIYKYEKDELNLDIVNKTLFISH